MAKRIEKDGKAYRMRRGELVEIPEEWVGKVAFKQTRMKRPSKKPPKLARYVRQVWHIHNRVNREEVQRVAIEEEL